MDSQPLPPTEPVTVQWWWWLLPVGTVAIMALLLWPVLSIGTGTRNLSYTQLVSTVDAGRVASVTIDDTGGVSGVFTDGSSFTSQVPTALGTAGLDGQLRAKNVKVTAVQRGGSSLSTVLGWLPVLLIVALFVWVGRQAHRSPAGGFGRSPARLVDDRLDTGRTATRFTDVAGYDGVKQEVSEVVDFLRAPQRYAAAGATGPRGVIMMGPPGTGKTLIARAVAGEAQVPFLSVTGSGFVEMFVGVGASRVRDLFDEARRRAPSIIFIDEVDAVGGRRGGPVGLGRHDEREQTLNQLLSEMDGFDQSNGVVILAATNRPETLDPALLRPGRFDRQVVVPLPNQAERAAILAVHAAGKSLALDVDLTVLARGTPGFSGADLANLVNEGAINAVRAGRITVTAADLDAARDRLLLGRRDTSNALLPDEKHAVAVHESGHALLAVLCPHADPVAKVTILPAGPALGATEQLPEAERHLYPEAYLTDLLTVRLGGRAAELIVLGQASTGAANDLSAATGIATRMVREFGLSPTLGPVGYAGTGPGYLGGESTEPLRRPYSEQTQRIIDREVADLLRQAEQRALTMLHAHRRSLERLAALLVEQETVDGCLVRQTLADSTGTGPDTPVGVGGYAPAIPSGG